MRTQAHELRSSTGYGTVRVWMFRNDWILFVAQADARHTPIFEAVSAMILWWLEQSNATKGETLRPKNAVAWGLSDSKGGDPAEWPQHLRVRQWPGMEVPAAAT